jgi:4-amino-4-deoxy-L-arabinose transferase-like glycosyltransferase
MRQAVQRIVVQDSAPQNTSRQSGERLFAGLSLLLVLAVVTAHVVWLLQDRGPMLWDDSMYAAGALDLYDGLDANGLPGLLQKFIHDSSAAKAPLIYLLPVPFFFLFGRGSEWAYYAVELLAFALTCFAAYRLVRKLSNGFGGLMAVIFLCFTPLLAGLTRQFMVEVPLLAAVVFWHYTLIRSEFLERPGEETKLGVILGIGTLLKVTFPLFILGSVLAGIVYRVRRRVDGRQALWSWTSGMVLTAAGIGAAAASVFGGLNGYLLAASLLIAALLARRSWSRRFPSVIEQCVVILGVGYLVAGAWYSEKLMEMVGYVWAASFGGAADPYYQPVGDYLAQICSFGVSNLQLALFAVGILGVVFTRKQAGVADVEDGDSSLRSAGHWLLFLWLVLPLSVFLMSSNRTIRFALPCIVALPIAGGVVGAVLQRRSLKLSIAWAATCALLGAGLFFSFSFGSGPVHQLAAGPLVFWGNQLDWDQRAPGKMAWPHRNIVRAAASVLSDSTEKTVFLMMNQPQLNWLNLKVAALKERLQLNFDFAGRFATAEAATARASAVPLLLMQEGGQSGPEWTEKTARTLAAALTAGGLGRVQEVYALRLPDGGNLRFFRRVETNTDPAADSLPPARVLFGNQMAIIGLELRRDGETLRWTAEWKAERDVDDDYAVYLHFADAQGNLFPRDHTLLSRGRGTRGLRQGAKFREEYAIPLTPELHKSTMLRVGVYEPATLSKFLVLDSTIPVLEGKDGIVLKVPE